MTDIAAILDDGTNSMKKAIDHFEAELTKIRAGKASPNMLDGIVVNYYGNPTPIGQVGNLSVMDARTLSEWVLADNLPVRVQLQLHKYIWDPATRGV